MVIAQESTFQYLKDSVMSMNLEDGVTHSILILPRPLLYTDPNRPQHPVQRREVLANLFLVLKQRECSSSTRVLKRKETEGERREGGREVGGSSVTKEVLITFLDKYSKRFIICSNSLNVTRRGNIYSYKLLPHSIA